MKYIEEGARKCKLMVCVVKHEKYIGFIDIGKSEPPWSREVLEQIK